MKYDVATNFDHALIKTMGQLDCVDSVYGKLPTDLVGGGRASQTLPQISFSKLAEHVDECHHQGISFKYLLNASCLDNAEQTRSFNKDLGKFIEDLKNVGVDGVTVGNVNLLRAIKSRFGDDLKLGTSIFMNASSIPRVLAFEKMGADVITLDENFNRDFYLLSQVVKATKPDTKLRVIANNPCLRQCPYMIPGHANHLAHASQAGHSSKGFNIDMFTAYCGNDKIRNPIKLITSPWIRPEDVSSYEDVGRDEVTGKDKIILKLTDRAQPTWWIERAVRAYAHKTSPENLFDVINFIGNEQYAQLRTREMIIGTLQGKANARELLKIERALFLAPVQVDSTKLDTFLSRFRVNPCDPNTVCDDEGWYGDEGFTESSEEGKCGYCKSIAMKVLSINSEERTSAIALTDALIESYSSGKMFKGFLGGRI